VHDNVAYDVFSTLDIAAIILNMIQQAVESKLVKSLNHFEAPL
jgi:hypothetical protein